MEILALIGIWIGMGLVALGFLRARALIFIR
jgi:hypothetical protein